MPVEIRQLQIRISVNEQQQNTADSAATTDNTNVRRDKEDALVAECVEQTLRILEEQEER